MTPYSVILSIVLLGAFVQNGCAYSYLIDNRVPVYNPYYYNPYINTYVNSYNHIGPLQNWPYIVQQSPYRYLGPPFHPYYNVQCYIVQYIYLCCAFNIRNLKCIPLQELYPKDIEPEEYDDDMDGSGDDTEDGGDTMGGDGTSGEDGTGGDDGTGGEDGGEEDGSEEGTLGPPVRRSVLVDDKDMFEFE